MDDSGIFILVPIHSQKTWGRVVDLVIDEATGRQVYYIEFDVDGITEVREFFADEISAKMEESLRFDEQVQHFVDFVNSKALTKQQRREVCDAMKGCFASLSENTNVGNMLATQAQLISPKTLSQVKNSLPQIISWYHGAKEEKSMDFFLDKLRHYLSEDHPVLKYKARTGQEVICSSVLHALLPVEQVTTKELGDLALAPDASQQQISSWVTRALKPDTPHRLQTEVWWQLNGAYKTLALSSRVRPNAKPNHDKPADSTEELLWQRVVQNPGNPLHGFARAS